MEIYLDQILSSIALKFIKLQQNYILLLLF